MSTTLKSESPDVTPEVSENTEDSSIESPQQRQKKKPSRNAKSLVSKASFAASFVSSSVQSAIVGTKHTLHLGTQEVRDECRQMTYEPAHHWWEPPLRAWIPEYNREILIMLFIYNAIVPVLAKFTDFCGDQVAESGQAFCSDEYILLQDKAISGFAVGMFLLLAFRSSQAYDRWWEGRKCWGRIREVSRDFARLVCCHVDVASHDDYEDRRRAINFVVAFGAAVKLHLRKEKDIRRDIDAIGCHLSCQDVANIQNASHMPLFCQDILSDYLAKQVKSGNLSDYQMGVINTTSLAVMSDALGSCERLSNTPIPLSYVLQLRFFMILWLILYPLHVVPYYGWWATLLTSLVASAVLGIESMACEIENPFGYDRNDLDLDSYVKGIFKETHEILGRREHLDRDKVFDRRQVLRMSACFKKEEVAVVVDEDETLDV